ncbi:uncharacterized protein zgc:152951 isoform X4 [Anguilla anguilla]|uniref:uncharacterized protein zgc:152951 isoform X4 n=1 Tax=Anguilla anguilla TaxID=7936 RepID=UPI0015B1B14C|nr:uncharacterized protein zgc:152951 isoform X4 [Anguilla anguilla]
MFFPPILISCGYGIQLTRWLSLHTNAGSPMEETEKSQKGMVTIYSVMGCPHCRQAKSRLLELGLPLREVDTNQHAELWLRVKQLTGRSTVPQIFFNSVHVGGNDDLQTMAPEKLEHLVHLVREEPMPPDAPPLPVEAHLEGGGNQDGENKCERDDFADMVAEFKECGVIGNHRKGLKMYKNSFTGVQLLDWLEREKGLAAELSEILRNMMLRLYSDHLSADGKTVDYKAMSQSPSFERYCELAVQLQRLDLQVLSRAEKLAFFINIYNALVIHGNLRLGAPKNPWQRYRFFNYVSYLIGGEVFTLQDIENGVLRGNKKGVAQLLKPFSKSDPRLQVALPQAEPLIHFALNCGAKGCPPIKTYTPKDIDSQLHIAAEAFLEEDDACRVDADKGEVKLSQVFKWYRGDFGDTDEKVLNWIVNHMSDSPKKSCLQALLKAGKFRVSYMPYDWSPNSKD